MSADPRVGTEVAGHRLISVVGRGGMSVVYLAEHLELGRKVALKILGPELVEDETFRERFIRESRIAAGLDHPNIVTVYDAGEAGDLLYLSMRYVEGSDLERLLRSATRLDPPIAVDIVSQCAAALDAAHAGGLVHRDVKPGNILLSSGGSSRSYHAYLSDFGVTKRMHTGASLTRTGQFVGTVDYVAPEQIQSDDVDGRADEYSLACVLFRCLTGDVPFPRDTEVGTIYAHLQDPPPIPSERRADLSEAFDAPILRALSKQRGDRFDSCGAFARAVARTVAPPDRVVVPATAHVASDQPRSRRRWAIGVIVLTVVALVAGALLLRRPEDGSRGAASRSPSPLPRLEWSGTQLPTGSARGTVTTSTGGAGTSLILAGRLSGDDGDDATVWSSSADGRWTRVTSPAFGGAADQRIDALGTGEGVTLAVGSETAGGDTDAAVWRSVDGGSSWQRIGAVTGGLHEGGDQAMLAVVPVSSGWVAAGWDRSSGDQDAAIWVSGDGTSWIRLTHPSFGGEGRQTIAAMTTARGQVVAAGWASGPAGDLDAAVWLNEDERWSLVAAEELGGPGDQRILAVAADDRRVVAAGVGATADEPRASVWISGDGREWVRASMEEPDDEGATLAVAPIEGGWVAGGWSDATGTRTPTVWLSSDGTRWSLGAEGAGPLPAVDDAFGGTVATIAEPGQGLLIAAGSARGGPAVVWTTDFT